MCCWHGCGAGRRPGAAVFGARAARSGALFDRGCLGRPRRALTRAGGDDGHGGSYVWVGPSVGNPAAALNEELVAYYQTYNKIPAFPPLGSTNKIFFVVLAATLIGLVGDLLVHPRVSSAVWRTIVFFMATLLIAVWIGLPRFAEAGLRFAALVAALVVGGTVVLWRLAMLGAAVPEGEGMDAAVLLAVLPAVFAPIALFGGSSTSVGLCLGLTAGFGMSALVNLFAPRRLGLAAVLGAGGGLLAVIDTITLITRQVDFLALAVFLATPFVGQIGARLILPRNWPGSRIRAVATGVMAMAPIMVILVILILRHDSPL